MVTKSCRRERGGGSRLSGGTLYQLSRFFFLLVHLNLENKIEKEGRYLVDVVPASEDGLADQQLGHDHTVVHSNTRGEDKILNMMAGADEGSRCPFEI
jgi:hypothetical protein